MTSDANGNTIDDGKRTNQWDSQSRLVSCQSVPDAEGHYTRTTYTYGSDGLRREAVVSSYTNLVLHPHPLTGGSPHDFIGIPIGPGVPITLTPNSTTKTKYVYDGQMLVEEIVQHFDSSGTATDSPATITYFQGPQGPLYRKASTEDYPHWYVYDGLGSVVGEVDPSGNLTATKLFDVYGATRGYTGTPTTRQGFVGGLGHETDDETGLVYMRARYYDPGTGRFVSEDPAKNDLNWFVYSDNNPSNRVDASGMSSDFFTGGILNELKDIGFKIGPFMAWRLSRMSDADALTWLMNKVKDIISGVTEQLGKATDDYRVMYSKGGDENDEAAYIQLGKAYNDLRSIGERLQRLENLEQIISVLLDRV